MNASVVFVALVVTVCAAQQQVKLRQCKRFGDQQVLKNLTITPCSSEPCTFERGQTYNATFTAEAPQDTEDVYVKLVIEQIGDFTVNMVTWVSCHYIDVPCTVKAGEAFSGNIRVPIHNSLSAGKLTIRIEVGPMTKKFACGEFDVVEL